LLCSDIESSFSGIIVTPAPANGAERVRQRRVRRRPRVAAFNLIIGGRIWVIGGSFELKNAERRLRA